LEVALCAGLATGLSVAVVSLVPAGGDLAAHLYRTSLVQHGVLVWDNLWFAGEYSLSAYSLLYYPLAALVGNAVVGVAGAVVAAGFFASVAQRQWGTAGYWPARVFAVLLAGQVFTAAYPFETGLAMLLAAIWALQRRRVWAAAVFMLLALGLSPLAFVFLGLALFGLFLSRRQVNRQTVIVASAGVVAVGIQLAALLLLPEPPLVYPYGTWQLLAGLTVAGLGVLLARRSLAGRPLAALFIVWAGSSVVVALLPSPLGRNMLRASLFAVPLMLVAASLARWRPRGLAFAAVAAALAANLLPYMSMISYRSSGVSARAAFWRPMIRFLHAHDSPDFRVEVVRTQDHWEDYFLPAAGIPLARGWYVQLDIADNSLLYDSTLSPAGYRQWLRRRAVRYVVLPNLPGELGYGGPEAALLRSGRSGLLPVLEGRQATIYMLPAATPLLTGPAAAAIERLDRTRISGQVARVGTYLLRASFNPYWTIRAGSLCLTPAGRGMTWLHMRRPGPFALQAIESPDRLLEAIITDHTVSCR
jgi:hypothetical protein